MPLQPLIQTLEKILLLHKSLNQLAKKKTEIIKAGDTEALNSLLKEEKKHILAIQKFENERTEVSKKVMAEKGKTIDKPTISDCIEVANIIEKQKLKELQEDLRTQINTLANQNKLNQQMLEQSLQFVNLSLDLLMPDIDTFNYERPGQSQLYEEGRSIFNSKA